MTRLCEVADVPHKGWRWEGVEDLEEAEHTCEFCGRCEIRYVHYVVHDDYPAGSIAVGYKCAEDLTEDYLRPQTREKEFRNRTARRRLWPNRQGWNWNATGNLVLKHQGVRYVVAPSGVQWRASYVEGGAWSNLPARFNTAREAQLALFDSVWPSRAGVIRRR